ncbi:MAG TPA: winged helix-turn-helix domain-containing protein [Pseudorhizobium sp.]|jgi:DNA-binding winged helix-turn-helix (wHTH) protein|nr:winged helix-turn-helix domain-containing protein [Pseudorhizobium sp.]
MKNRLSDLNDHLFMQLERLSDEDLTPEQIETEAKRGTAMVDVADTIIRNASLQIQAAKIAFEGGTDPVPYLPAPGVRAVEHVASRTLSVPSSAPLQTTAQEEETRGAARRRAEAREQSEWIEAEGRQAADEAEETGNLAAAMQAFGLSRSEGALLVALLPGRVMSKQALHDALYADRADAPEIKIVDVLVCKVRAKTAPKGITIETVHGLGFQLAAGVAAQVRAILGLPDDAARIIQADTQDTGVDS